MSCANVACLLLAQARQRRREIAIRFSLGARRWQIVRELMLESFVYALPGALLGLALAVAALQTLRQYSKAFPRSEEIHLDWRIVAFTLSLSVVTTILFGLFPSFEATRDQTRAIHSTGSRTMVGGRGLGALVMTQIAFAIVLLVGAGLLIRTLSRLGETPLGFVSQKILCFHVSASWGETKDPDKIEQRLVRTLDALRAIPGVESAAVTTGLPHESSATPGEFTIVGRPAQGEKLFAEAQIVSSNYFHVLQIPILSGHTCRAIFDAKAPPVALIDRTFADRFFPGQNPVGQSLTVGDPTPLEIIGVVGAVRQHGASHDPVPTIYSCAIPRYFPDPAHIVKTAADPLALAETVRRRIHSIEPNRAVYDVTSLTDYLSGSLSARTFQTTLLGLFAATALVLAVIGLYGVMSFFVTERTREIGLRMALGAQPKQILARVFRIAAVMTLSGVALGLAASTWLTRSMESQLYGVAPIDPLTFCAVPLLLILIAATAAWSPARRAMKVDPMEALRQE
jgi:putative ABC transport system permease protein